MSSLWLVDRSRIVDGRGFCQRARLLNYHAGPSGYGITMKATKLPLITGIGGHAGLEPILQWCAEHPDWVECPPNEVIRAAIQQAHTLYSETVAARGFAYLSDDEGVQAVCREQQYLIEGLIWAWCLQVLPEVLSRTRILEVEHDETYVFQCTCGLGAGIGSALDHESRDCAGMGLMCKGDFIAETRLTHELEYHEFKTTSMDSITFREKWEVQAQLIATTLDVERRYGRQVQSVYIHGLVKGRRQGEYNPDTKKYDGGGLRQQSVFCYGYRKPANPPMEREEWAATYEYWDDFEGKLKRLGGKFKRAGVWELPDSLVPEGIGKAEFWAKWIPDEARKKQLIMIGPLSRPSGMVEHFLTECEGEEGRWQAGLWQLHDCAVEILAGYHDATADHFWQLVWPNAQYQRLMDLTFPRSYECRRYGARNRCQFESVCFDREGSLDPIGSGQFIARAPHHEDERRQMIERGLAPTDPALVEEIEQEF